MRSAARASQRKTPPNRMATTPDRPPCSNQLKHGAALGRHQALSHLLLDLRRAFVTCWTIGKYWAGPAARRLVGLPQKGLGIPERFRLTVEDLGLTYVKVGQFLALRYDLLPAEVCRELGKLFEQVAPVPFEDVRRVVEDALGGSLQRFFSEFEQKPLASASVAQVHRARTRDDRDVAVKIRRPGIGHAFGADIRNMRRAASIVDALGFLGSISLREFVEEFADWTGREMNFVIEGQSADRLRRNSLHYEIIPQIHWELTTDQVLTMDFIEGMTLVQFIDLLQSGRAYQLEERLPNLNTELIANRIAQAVLRQLFVSGFFHGDPHPGNLIIRDDNSIAFIDFGIYGELTDQQRETLAGHIENVAIGNINESFRYYAAQYTPTEETDLRDFEREGKRILRNWYNASMNPYASARERHLATHGAEMLGVVRRNRLRLSMNTLLFWRALYTLDSVALRLSDYIDLMSQIQSFFYRIRPGLAERWVLTLYDRDWQLTVAGQACSAPLQAKELLSDLSRGGGRSSIRLNAAPSLRRSRVAQARDFAVALAGLSAAVLGTTGVGAPLGAAMLAAAAVLLSLGLFNVARRR